MITLEPSLLSFESVLIGSTEQKEVFLCNKSNCYVSFLLSYELDSAKEEEDLDQADDVEDYVKEGKSRRKFTM